jgi:hypothetical protein
MSALDAEYLVVTKHGEILGVLSRRDLEGPAGGLVVEWDDASAT